MGDPSAYRLPSFMDVFAAWSSKEYINVGLKWNVVESKAAMAYATRLSAGHTPITLETDDYHIEAFSKPKEAKGASDRFTKMRFRQKGVYSGTVGYAEPIQGAGQTDKSKGQFVFWDNKQKTHARLLAGQLQVERNSQFNGDLRVKGKATIDSVFETAAEVISAKTKVGSTPLGAKLEAEAGKGLGLYTVPAGGTADAKAPRVFVTDQGSVGIGSTKPVGMLQIESGEDKVAVRVHAGKVSVG